MTAVEMIAEWRRGCSCAQTDKPEEFQECTRALIEAIDGSLPAAQLAATAQPDTQDAARYRWLRDTMMRAVGGGVEVNDAKLVYEEAEAGQEVRVYWYPDTAVGFHESHGSTLDAAIDAAMKDE